MGFQRVLVIISEGTTNVTRSIKVENISYNSLFCVCVLLLCKRELSDTASLLLKEEINDFVCVSCCCAKES
jgi:hypothetical protein